MKKLVLMSLIISLLIITVFSSGCLKTSLEIKAKVPEEVKPKVQNEVNPPEIVPEPAPGKVAENSVLTIDITRRPQTANERESIWIRWEINSEQPLTVTHTAVHYDSVSHGGNFGTEIGPQKAGYAFLTKEFASGEFLIPDEFVASIALPQDAGAVYLRAHAISGDKNYWTEEKKIGIVKSGCQYNNPACGTDYNCLNNACVLKSGCSYNNPDCSSGYRCENNQCVGIRGGGGGY